MVFMVAEEVGQSRTLFYGGREIRAVHLTRSRTERQVICHVDFFFGGGGQWERHDWEHSGGLACFEEAALSLNAVAAAIVFL